MKHHLPAVKFSISLHKPLVECRCWKGVESERMKTKANQTRDMPDWQVLAQATCSTEGHDPVCPCPLQPLCKIACIITAANCQHHWNPCALLLARRSRQHHWNPCALLLTRSRQHHWNPCALLLARSWLTWVGCISPLSIMPETRIVAVSGLYCSDNRSFS